MSSIDLYLHYGGELHSDVIVIHGLTYEGPNKKLEIIQLNDAIFMLYMCFHNFCRQALDNTCEHLKEYAILNVEDQGGTIFKDFAVPLNFLA